MFEIFRPSVNENNIMNSTSAAISYPTLKGLESSNSSFVQVSQPIRDVNRNLTLNHRNSASRADRGHKSKMLRPHEFAQRNDELSINRRPQREHSSRGINLNDKEMDNDGTSTEPVDRYGKKSEADCKTSVKAEKLQQDNIEESMARTTDVSSKEKKQSETITELSLSLMKPELVQGLINKHPKHTIIINNTFINRSSIEQDEFLAKFSPTFYSQNPTVEIVRDASYDQSHMKTVADGGAPNEMPKPEAHNDIQSSDVEKMNFVLDDPNDNRHKSSCSVEESAPLGAIITAILWLALIAFWLLLYLKVVSVCHSLPKVIPKPEPTNYELFLVFITKFRNFFAKFWRFW